MNYAYTNSSSPFNIAPFTQQMSQNSLFQNGFYNDNPSNAFEAFLKNINPSLSQQDILHRMLASLTAQWENKQSGQLMSGTKPTSFTDFLSQYNYGQELAGMSPSVRKESPQSFMRPVRVVTF